MSVDQLLKDGEAKMQKTINETKKEFVNIRTGRANPMILDKLSIEYYGVPTPLKQLANVSVQEGNTLVVQAYDKGVIAEIEKAILKSDLGVTPNNDGTNIRITFPPLTEERRKDLTKKVKKIGEDGKVAIRNRRRDMTDALKKLEKEESLPEDQVKDFQNDIQKVTDKYTKEIDKLVTEKEKEVLTV